MSDKNERLNKPSEAVIKFEQSERLYRPSEVVVMIAEGFGYFLTASVIRKYDYQILADLVEPREPNAKRLYSKDEMVYFLIIAVLRSLGFSIRDVKKKVCALVKGDIEGMEAERIMGRLDRQKLANVAVYTYFKTMHDTISKAAKKG
jgi:DNA-binding transcriptional MerR regulator